MNITDRLIAKIVGDVNVRESRTHTNSQDSRYLGKKNGRNNLVTKNYPNNTRKQGNKLAKPENEKNI